MRPVDPLAVIAKTVGVFPAGFSQFIRDNPVVWWEFVTMTEDVINRGFKHYSSQTIIEVMRHHTAVAEVGGGFKLNNDNCAYLSRLFVACWPEHSGFFRHRMTALEKRAA